MSETSGQEIAVGVVPSGESRVVQVGGEQVAVFHIDGQYHAVSNKCPHRGGPLSRGHLEPVGTVPAGGCPQDFAVRCPIHGWLFELKSGRCLNQPQAQIRSYALRVEGDQVYLTA